MELDHLFVCVTQDAPEAERLIEFGLSEGAPNTHPGQGTANRRFFFHNAFLELVWVADPAEAQSELVARTGLWQRWSQRRMNASPFGVCVRPTAGSAEGRPPFATWRYTPPYLPPPLAIDMATSSHRVSEPLLFHLAFGRRPDSNDPDPARRQPLDHAAGLREITRVRISGPSGSAPSNELRALASTCSWFSFATDHEDVAEIGFDGEAAGKVHDFRPHLPLIFSW
ncbi:MAG: VOC family protein [Pirellulales bacterium]